MQTVNVMLLKRLLFLDVSNVLCLMSNWQEDGEVAVQYSGNPGYVFGRPLVSGTKRAEYPLPA